MSAVNPGSPSVIKSIQYATATIDMGGGGVSVNVTITAVNIAKTVLSFLGTGTSSAVDAASWPARWGARLTLNSSTQVNFNASGGVGTTVTGALVIGFCVTEYA